MYLEKRDVPTGHDWNIVTEAEFKKSVREIFEMVSDALAHTLGPYGSTTIIEQHGEVHITKDGWNVLKSIRYANMIDNNILALLKRISAQVVGKVGDGSTSSIVAANEVLKAIEASPSLKCMRPKEVVDMLTKCVDTIIERIYSNATPVNKDNYDEIYHMAHVATNGDDEISEMIHEIYKATGNPVIEYVKSKTGKTSMEITEGYRGNISYLDAIYATNDSGKCELNKPYFLMFDFKIDKEMTLPIISAAAMHAAQNGSRLVVVAPNYDKFLVDYIRVTTNQEFKSRATSLIVYTKATLISNLTQDMYRDFAMMVGAEIINEEYVLPSLENGQVQPKDIEDIAGYLGQVEHATIDAEATYIEGYIARNKNRYNLYLQNAEHNLAAKEEDNMTRGIIDEKANEYKTRVRRLRGSIGVINVGGVTTLEQKAKYDLVDDAVKACESAFMYGYNIGGNLVIPKHAIDIINETVEDGQSTMPVIELELYRAIANAFMEVYMRVLRNAQMEESDIERTVETCLTDGNIYDLVKEEFSNNIINPCATDVEILKATVSIVSLLVSSNQYVSLSTREGF